MYKMAEAISVKAKTVLNHVLNSLGKLPCIPINTFMKMFDFCFILYSLYKISYDISKIDPFVSIQISF